MILGTSRAVRVHAYPEAVDLRKGYDGLFGLVKQGLGRDPLSGDLFLFVNARRKGCKVLLWDGTGLCIFQKRLERGRFASPWRDDGQVVRMTASELALFVEGCEWVGRRALSPEAVLPSPPGRLEKRTRGIDNGAMELTVAAADGSAPRKRY